MLQHQKLAAYVAIVIVIGLAAVIFTPPEFPNRADLVGFCFILGTHYAQVTLLAAWMAFGPFPFLWRLPLSLVGVACLAIALGFNFVIYQGPPPYIFIVLGGFLIAQWFVAQIPLWGLGLAYGLRLLHPEHSQMPANPRDRQFGIRELLIFTTIIAVILGIGRVLVGSFARNIFQNVGVGVFPFLAVAGILVSLPLLVAGLLRRYSGWAVIIGLATIGLATLAELALLDALMPARGGPNLWHLTFINTFTAAWILAYVFAIRRAGYRLAIARLPSKSTA